MELVETLNFAHDIYEKVQNDEIVFDFSQIRNFDLLPMLIMGATMGFFKYVSDSLGIGKCRVKQMVVLLIKQIYKMRLI